MLQNLIVAFVLLGAVAYLTFSYVKKRRSKTGCAHCAVANRHAANGNRAKTTTDKS